VAGTLLAAMAGPRPQSSRVEHDRQEGLRKQTDFLHSQEVHSYGRFLSAINDFRAAAIDAEKPINARSPVPGWIFIS
jgi:hypothetical protein